MGTQEDLEVCIEEQARFSWEHRDGSHNWSTAVEGYRHGDECVCRENDLLDTIHTKEPKQNTHEAYKGLGTALAVVIMRW